MKLSYEDQEALRCAKALLENPSLAAKITGLIGMPLEKALKLLPDKWTEVVNGGERKSLETALQAALLTLDDTPQPSSWEFLHKLAVGAIGAGGGAFGLAGLPVELPLSTAIMLRSIADIARSEGERLGTPGAKLRIGDFSGLPRPEAPSFGGFWRLGRAGPRELSAQGAAFIAQPSTRIFDSSRAQ